MKLTYPIPPVVNGDLLTAELMAAGITDPLVVIDPSIDRLVIYVSEDDDVAAVANVVGAHDATAHLAEEEANRLQDDQDWAQLETVLAKCRAVVDGTDTFTNAQAQQLLARLTLLVARWRRG